MSTPTLVDALKRFNRKERYWLIRNALGPTSERLDDGFRASLAQAIGMEVPATAWWAMDYHLDWLVGALTLVAQGDRGFEAQSNDAGLVNGNQEDMDLIVAFDDALVMIEAKGETVWSNTQFQSKVARLEKLRAAGLLPASIKIFFVLTSPSEPKFLVPEEGTTWQAWMCNPAGRPMHMPLRMPDDFLKVTRWDAEQKAPSRAGTCWKIVAARGAEIAQQLGAAWSAGVGRDHHRTSQRLLHAYSCTRGISPSDGFRPREVFESQPNCGRTFSIFRGRRRPAKYRQAADFACQRWQHRAKGRRISSQSVNWPGLLLSLWTMALCFL